MGLKFDGRVDPYEVTSHKKLDLCVSLVNVLCHHKGRKNSIFADFSQDFHTIDFDDIGSASGGDVCLQL